jgi:cellulose 1,4-beta-cellobiosidase
MVKRCAVLLLLSQGALSQQAGTQKTEDHLPLTLSECTATGCTGQAKNVTLDANWRWTHKVPGYANCYTNTSWDPAACDTPEDCAKNCALDGVPTADWNNTYGVTSDGSDLSLRYKTGTNVGSRTYLLDNETHYKMFKLLNREFTFDVDISKLPCGINGALYFTEMMADGGSSEFSGNEAGAKFGTGYCDAQCPHDIKFINGEANTLEWNTTTVMGKYGSCCSEMDIWESNSQATAYTAHPCSIDGPKRCENEKDCGQNGFCDRFGCDLNTYRYGNKTFFGEGSTFAVDTTKPFTIVTQFITSDNTDTGNLTEIRQSYVQGGKVIETPKLDVDGKAYNSISTDFCTAQKKETGDKDEFALHGGFKQMGEALGRGMVLVMSIWDDSEADMLWLDSTYPVGSSAPGAKRGPCDPSTGVPAATRAKYPDSSVKYMNIKFGAIGSTTKFPPAPAPPAPAPTPPAPGPSPPAPSPSSGQCCYGGCSGGNCQGGWCGQSQSNCEGNCQGKWCPKITEVVV